MAGYRAVLAFIQLVVRVSGVVSMPHDAQIGQRLAYIRGRESQAAFAARLGIHKNTLGNYERGDREIGATALLALVRLGWNANWVLTGDGECRLDADGSVQAGTSGLDRRRLGIAMHAVESALRDRVATPVRKAELVSAVYDLAGDDARISAAVLRLLEAVLDEGGD